MIIDLILDRKDDDYITIIENDIDYIIDKAIRHKKQIRYYLEKLPMVEDYDTKIHEYINQIEYYIDNIDAIDIIKSEMVEYYYYNWNIYKDMFF